MALHMQSSPAIFMSVEEFAQLSIDSSNLFRINGFLFEDICDSSGFSSILSSTRKRARNSSNSFSILTQKIVSWPEHLREGGLVQVVGTLQSMSPSVLQAISLVIIEGMNTEHDLSILLSSHLRIVKFLQQPIPLRHDSILDQIRKVHERKKFTDASSFCSNVNSQSAGYTTISSKETDSGKTLWTSFDEFDDSFGLDENLMAAIDQTPCTSSRKEKQASVDLKSEFQVPVMRPKSKNLRQSCDSVALASRNAGKFSGLSTKKKES